MWDVGNVTDSGRSTLNLAGMWVEFVPELHQSGRASVRLLPLDPRQWRHVAPGERINMHECAQVDGTATILELRRRRAPQSVRGASG